ncbi:hypothetical protein ADK76_06790 [Streptomyces griseoflavus]|uniref:hypothetical protein n=1 Tax=Streptomyces TaxID=1883 RepID=UPI0004C6BB15|nr:MULTISPECIES: hypothetical protein [Streptomyces]KOG65289.1 hypothetical protein ADK76_06790 [Streptomyces griseoflavus]KOU05780.1 hypothetical protein ADK86_06875 [Streptomyces sp. NRRL F-5755]KWT56535.1 hypothetical protein ADL21_39250 [Streptomyces albus subsp. albus]
MPLIPEEPQIHESVPGPRATPAAGRTASTPRPVPGPGPRPAPPRGAPAASARPGKPGPAAPSRGPAGAPPAQRTGPKQPAATAGPADAASGAQLQLIPAPQSGALDAAEEAVDLLLDSGRAPGEILVLTTGEMHPWAAHELSFGEASYWAQHDAADDVFYADAAAERATGRPVVVVAVNGGAEETIARALPAAMARAGALLVVCGDPQRINALLGVSA